MTDTQLETATHPTAARPSLVERAKAVAPSIAARAHLVEESRQVHPDSMQELIDCGLTRALQSSVYGGEEANPADFYQAVVEVAKACMSTGWILMLLGAHTWEMAHMSQEVNDELFGDDPTTLISSSYNMQGNVATRVPGGYRLSGSWKSSSGVTHSKWVVLGANVPGEPAAFNFLVPLDQVTLVDDWFVLGLRGTGSWSVIVDDVFVPEHRTMDRDILRAGLAPGLKVHTAPLFRVPQAYIYTCVSSAPALGNGWRYFEEFKKSYSKSSTVSRTLEGDRLLMIRLAEARGALSSAGIVSPFRLNEAYEAACRGEELTDLEIAQGMYDISRNGKLMLDMINLLQPSLRPNAIYATSIMERLYRDAVVARQHGTSNLDERGDALAAYDMNISGGHTLLLSPEKRAAAYDRAREHGYI